MHPTTRQTIATILRAAAIALLLPLGMGAATAAETVTSGHAGFATPRYPIYEQVNADIKPRYALDAVGAPVRLFILGIQAGPPMNKDYAHPAVALEVNGHYYLVDAGSGVVQRLTQIDVQPPQVRNIFLTHLHLDHTAGLGALLTESWFLGNEGAGGVDVRKAPPVAVYGPPSTDKLVGAIVDEMQHTARIFNDDYGVGNFGYLKPDALFAGHAVVVGRERPQQIYQDENVTVTAVENAHYHFKPGTPAYEAGDRSYSYRFDTPQGAIVFTGDTGPTPALTDLARGADVLASSAVDRTRLDDVLKPGGAWGSASESDKARTRWHARYQHLGLDDVGKLAQAAGVKTVLLYHYWPFAAGRYIDGARFVQGIKQYFGGEVLVTRDLFEYDLVK